MSRGEGIVPDSSHGKSVAYKERKRKLSPQRLSSGARPLTPPPVGGVRGGNYRPKSPQRGSFANRRQNTNRMASRERRYSPAVTHRRIERSPQPSRSHSRSRSGSRSRPVTRRRSRSQSLSSGSSRSGSVSSSSPLAKRRRRPDGRLGSPGHSNSGDDSSRSIDRSGALSSNRCRDYEERGYCVRGDLCPFDHGNDPVVVDDVGLPAVLGFPGVTREMLNHRPPGLPTPAPGTVVLPPTGPPPSSLQGLPDVTRPPGALPLPLPSLRYHSIPNVPAAAPQLPFLHPPPLPGALLFPPGMLPTRLAPPPHVEPYLPEPFAPRMSAAAFRQQLMQPPPTGHYTASSGGPPPQPSPISIASSSAAHWVSTASSTVSGAGSSSNRHGYGLVQSSASFSSSASAGGHYGDYVPANRLLNNLVLVPTLSLSGSTDSGKIKVSEFKCIPSCKPYTYKPPLVSESKPTPTTSTAVVEPTESTPAASLPAAASGVVSVAKKPNFEWHRHPGLPWGNKLKNVSNATLELRRVPPEMNTISKINEHFARFGTLVNLQVAYGGDPEAALVSFASPQQASAAYHCSEPMFNNRFIKIFWHNPDRPNQMPGGGSGAGTSLQSQQQTTQVKSTNEVESRPFPPAHQMQLNNKRNFASTSSQSVVKTEPFTTSSAPSNNSLEVQKKLLGAALTSPEATLASTVGPPLAGGVPSSPSDTSGGPAVTTSGSSAAPTVASSMYVLPRPGSMRLNCRDQMKKEALKKRLELHKQKQSLLDRQIQQQKLLLDKLEKNKKMNAEEKSSIVETIKKLALSIDKLKTELSAAVGRLPASVGSFSKSNIDTKVAVAGSGTGAVVLRPTKLVRVPPPPAAVPAPSIPTMLTAATPAPVSSTAADSVVTSKKKKVPTATLR